MYMTAQHPEARYFDIIDRTTGDIVPNVSWINEEAGYIGLNVTDKRRRSGVNVRAVRGDYALVPIPGYKHTRPSH